MSFPRYPAYKPSDLNWLGEVPDHWDLRRLGYYFGERREKVSDRDYQPLSVTKEGIVPQLETAAKTDDGDNRKRVCEGDFVINSRSDRKGSAGLSELDGSVSLISTVLKPKESVHGSFVHHLLRSVPFQEEFYRFGKGIVADLWSTNFTAMQGITLAMPSHREQLAIASFLDRETAKIDALIAEQKRLIEVLQEKRQAVISHAVTKGLNPNAPMKDSGVEWLGEVPDHWVVASIRRYIRIAEGQVDPRLDTYSAMTLIAPNHIESGTGLLTSLETAGEQGAESGKYLCDLGDVVYSKIRPALRKACIAPETCLTSADMYPLKAMDGMSNEFLLNFLLSPQFSALAIVESERVAMPKINRDALLAVSVAVPPLSEQQEICSHVKELTTRIDQLSVQASSSITLMNERRTALISAAVTGQIDVRGLSEAECGEQ